MTHLYRDCWQHLYDVERRRIPATPVNHLRLQRLERPEPWLAELQLRMQQALDVSVVQQYPDYITFYDRLAKYAGVDPTEIVVGQGIEELVRMLFLLSCDPGDVVVYPWPTCAMFDVYAEVFGATAVRIETDPKQPLLIADICEQIDLYSSVKMVLLPHPGQPVDLGFDFAALATLAAACYERDIVLAIDEAYHGFGAVNALPLFRMFDNVVILRTFSKALGAASIRVGWAMGQARVLQPLNAIRLSGEIAGPSMQIATAIMDNEALVAQGIADVVAGRDWLLEKLWSEDCKVFGGTANHVLLDCQGPAEGVADLLREHGIHIKGNFDEPLRDYMLITCGSTFTMRRFYDVFNKVTE